MILSDTTSFFIDFKKSYDSGDDNTVLANMERLLFINNVVK